MRTDELTFPDCLNKLVVANDINDFVVHKIKGILADIDTTVVGDAVPIDSEVGDDHICLFLSTFNSLTESDESLSS